MIVLTPLELDCLQRLANVPHAMIPACAERELQHLLSLRLIEIASAVSLPLEMRRTTYALTATGRSVLRQHLNTPPD